MLDKVERSRPGFFKKGCTTACLKLLGTAGGQIIINNIKDRGTNSSKNLLQKVNNITWEAKLFYTGKQFLKRGKGNRLQVIKDSRTGDQNGQITQEREIQALVLTTLTKKKLRNLSEFSRSFQRDRFIKSSVNFIIKDTGLVRVSSSDVRKIFCSSSFHSSLITTTPSLLVSQKTLAVCPSSTFTRFCCTPV